MQCDGGVQQCRSRILLTYSSKRSFQERSVSLHEAADDITTGAKDAGFQNVSDNDVIVFLESHSLPLTNKELAELDRQSYKEAQDDHDDECDFTRKYLSQ
jgi:hypothetical protein